jgi:hypothetical protein
MKLMHTQISPNGLFSGQVVIIFTWINGTFQKIKVERLESVLLALLVIDV